MPPTPESSFRAARDLLLAHRSDWQRARDLFRWPRLERFNWALDHFDLLAEELSTPALILSHEDGSRVVRSFGDLARASSRLANLLRDGGVQPRDCVLLMLPNVEALWLTILACIKLGAVVVPATPQLTIADVEDRVARGGVRHVVSDPSGHEKLAAVAGFATRWTTGPAAPGLSPLDAAESAPDRFAPAVQTRATDPMLLYFTSGTTARPKLVLHTHESYPVGHLSTMYFIGLVPGDVHWNISSPGWAKHAWSNVFAPWNAGATVFVRNVARFSASDCLATLRGEPVTTLCAPPTVWRMLVQEPLSPRPAALRECVAAGEPLNPEVIAAVRAAWGLDVRDGFGQTETTALIGNSPGQPVKPGSMGRPLPGYEIALLGEDGRLGEVVVRMSPRPVGVMAGYLDASGEPQLPRHDSSDDYATGDVAERDEDGYVTFVGRADDVFKASDYRISPFELESVLIEHPDVVEAAVVPSPDPLRLAVPKAFVVLRAGCAASPEVSRAILAFVRERVPPFKRVRRLEIVRGDASAPAEGGPTLVLPKTISGKIRRVELRQHEATRDLALGPGPWEIWD